MKINRMLFVPAIGLTMFSGASAQDGPVAEACSQEITQYCADKTHGDRGVRTCLEENIDKVSESCTTALETTGGSRGQGQRSDQNAQ